MKARGRNFGLCLISLTYSRRFRNATEKVNGNPTKVGSGSVILLNLLLATRRYWGRKEAGTPCGPQGPEERARSQHENPSEGAFAVVNT